MVARPVPRKTRHVHSAISNSHLRRWDDISTSTSRRRIRSPQMEFMMSRRFERCEEGLQGGSRGTLHQGEKILHLLPPLVHRRGGAPELSRKPWETDHPV